MTLYVNMVKYKIIFDRDACIGALSCNAVSPDFWKLSEDGKVDLKKMNNVFSHNTKMKPTKCTTIYKALLHLYSCDFIIIYQT